MITFTHVDMIKEAVIEQTLAQVFDNIEFTAEPKGLYDPLRYMIGIGGKRIRPRLCLTAYGLYKDEFADGILDAAAAVEVFHTFTLIHDDIMDNAPIRRGQPTVWKKWSVNTAVLSGDVMNIDSYRRLANINPSALPAALKLFNTTAAQVCEGQQLDMEFESCPKVKMTEYMKMIGLKTGVLIACAAKMGAIIADAPKKDADLLYDYGYDLGIAFQIADDYLDTFGDVKTFGKAIGGDILNDKKTWLLTRAMEKDADAVARAMALPVGTPEQDKAKIDAVSAVYRDLGIDEDAKYEILKYTQKSMEHVCKIGLTKVKEEMLARYADKLVGRTK